MLLCSKPFLSIQKITAYQVFNIKHDFEYQITNSIFVIRTAAVFHVLGSKTFLSIWKVTEYQVFNIKTNFWCTILNIKLQIRYA